MCPIFLRIGFLSFKTYGLFLAAAFLAGYILLVKKTLRENFAPEEIQKLFLWIIVSSIAGARLLYLLLEGDMDWKYPLSAFRLWEGGLHYFGGLAGAILSVVAFRIRHPSFRMWRFADAVAPSLALGLAIGKLGCFSAGCCYGIPSNLPWAVTFTHPDSLALNGIPLHPVQLYESLVYTIVFFVIERLYYRYTSRGEGELFCLSVLGLSSARFFLDFLRWDKKIFLGLHSGGIISLIFIVVSSGCIFFIRKKS